MLTLNDFYQYFFGDRGKLQGNASTLNTQKSNIQEKFKALKKSPSFRALLRETGASNLEEILFGNTSDTVKIENIFPTDTAIQQSFFQLNEKYLYFNKKEALTKVDDFLVLFKGLFLLEILIENNKDIEQIYLHAYKILVLFGVAKGLNPFRPFEEYKNDKAKNSTIYTLLKNDIPVNQGIHLSPWKKLIKSSTSKCLEIFPLAAKIEKNLGHAPIRYEQGKITLLYKRWREHPELAELCCYHHVNQVNFNRCLTIELQRKKTDNLPNVLLSKDDFILVKLPINDPHAYLLGRFTKCCQSIDGKVAEVHQCVIDGITKENNGFYVVLKPINNKKNKVALKENGDIDYSNYKIIAQAYAWKSRLGNLVFDSLDIAEEKYYPAATALFKDLGKKAAEIDPEIMAVTIGRGGRTPKYFTEQPKIQCSENMKEGYQYHESLEQSLVYSATEKQQEIIDLIKTFFQDTSELGFIEKKTINRIIKESIPEERTGSLWQVLFLLHQKGFLTEENVRIFIRKNDDNFNENVVMIINYISKNNSIKITEELLKKIIQNKRAANALSIIIRRLETTNISNTVFSYAILEKLLDNTDLLVKLARLVPLLHANTLLNADNFIKIVDNEASIARIENSLKQLKTQAAIPTDILDQIIAGNDDKILTQNTLSRNPAQKNNQEKLRLFIRRKDRIISRWENKQLTADKKAIFEDFLTYYTQESENQPNRAILVENWEKNYRARNGKNPFATLYQQRGFFKSAVTDSIKAFREFLQDENISYELRCILYSAHK